MIQFLHPLNIVFAINMNETIVELLLYNKEARQNLTGLKKELSAII